MALTVKVAAKYPGSYSKYNHITFAALRAPVEQVSCRRSSMIVLSAAFVKYDNKTGLPVEPINSFFCIFLLSSHLTNAALVRNQEGTSFVVVPGCPSMASFK